MSCKLETWEHGRNACFECIIDGEVGSARAGWRQQSPSRAGRWVGGSRLPLIVMGRRMVIVMLLSMIAVMMTIRSQWLLVSEHMVGMTPSTVYSRSPLPSPTLLLLYKEIPEL